MANIRDPYHVLGVSRSASAEDIKKAYRKLAKEFHPDLKPGNAGNEDRFKEISAAYSVLSDVEKRARFDRGEIDGSGAERHSGHRSHASSSARGRTHAHQGDDPFGKFDGNDDWFSDLFSGGRRKRPEGAAGVKAKGTDIAYAVTVPFIEAAVGSKRRISLSSGRSIDVAIPPGTENEQKLRLKGQGLPGLGGAPAGDAIIEVHVEPHPHFTRQDGDIHVEVPVALNEAILGATIRVPTISGPVAVKVPPGSNTGSVLRLRGKGVVSQKTKQTGDQYVKLKVVLPDPPDAELVQFMEKWAAKRSYDVRKKAGLE